METPPSPPGSEKDPTDRLAKLGYTIENTERRLREAQIMRDALVGGLRVARASDLSEDQILDLEQALKESEYEYIVCEGILEAAKKAYDEVIGQEKSKKE